MLFPIKMKFTNKWILEKSQQQIEEIEKNIKILSNSLTFIVFTSFMCYFPAHKSSPISWKCKKKQKQKPWAP